MATINYNLHIAIPKRGVVDGDYTPSRDGWIQNDADVQRLNDSINLLLKDGITPIVTVFAPKRDL